MSHASAPASLLDPDDVTKCTLDPCCELCGDREYLDVRTLKTDLGLVCMTLCPECELEPIPPLSLGVTLARVGEHCEHLGADLDEVAAALEAKDAGR